jgi:hypothetical protein
MLYIYMYININIIHVCTDNTCEYMCVCVCTHMMTCVCTVYTHMTCVCTVYTHTRVGSPVGGPHSLGEIREAAAVNVLSRLFAFAFAVHGGALGLLCSIMA